MAGETELVMTAEVARRLSGLGGLYDIDYHARAIRHWVQIGLLEPVSYRGQGRTAAALFDEPQILLARLLFAMTATGISPQQMAAAKRLFRNVHPSPRGTWSGLATVAKRLRAGERWHFVIHLMIDEDLGLAGGFEEIPDLGNPLIEGQKPMGPAQSHPCRATPGAGGKFRRRPRSATPTSRVRLRSATSS